MAHLTDFQLRDLDRNGYLAPLPFCSPDRVNELRTTLEAAIGTPGPWSGDPWAARHHDCPAVFDICASEPLRDVVAQVLGPDLAVWNTVLWNKKPGDAAIPWHQDHDFDYLQPDVGLAVWLAIDDVTVANGCVEVIPGTHRDVLPFIPRTVAGEFDSRVPDSIVGGHRPVPIALRAGEFMLFCNKILHRSGPNRSPRRRLGLTIRYTTTFTRVDASKFFPGYRLMSVRTDYAR